MIDKTRNNRETVRSINGKILNDLGGNRTGTISIESSGPVSVTLKVDSSSPLQHTTRLTLFNNSNRIEIANEIKQNFSSLNTWSYSFDISSRTYGMRKSVL